MRLLLDNRERHLAKFLEDLFEDIAFAQLPVGDYLLISDSGAIIIERKSVNDFLSSIRSNRLWDQLLRIMKTEKVLGHNVKRKILLIHGNFEDYFDVVDCNSQDSLVIRWSQLMGAYLEIVYVYNTPIFHAENDTAFKAFMRILAKRETAGKNAKLPVARWYRKPARKSLPVKDRKRYILSALAHIGERLAENLLLHFDTISEIACASVKELQKVPKIGKKKAEIIYTMFH
jgi:DNA excision repair protein ERCC-4